MIGIEDKTGFVFSFYFLHLRFLDTLGRDTFSHILTFKVQGMDFFFIHTSEVFTQAKFMVPPVAIPTSNPRICLILFIVTSASHTRIFNFFIIVIVIIRHTVIWIFIRSWRTSTCFLLPPSSILFLFLLLPLSVLLSFIRFTFLLFFFLLFIFCKCWKNSSPLTAGGIIDLEFFYLSWDYQKS